MREVEKFLRAEYLAAHDLVDHAAARKVHDAVAERARVHAQPLVGRQECEDGIGKRAEPEFERRTVRNERGSMARDRALRLAWGAVGERDGGTRGMHREREVAFAQQALGVRPRDAVVDFRDDRAADLERGNQIFCCEPEAVLALSIGRADLNEHHVGANRARTDERGQARIRMRMDVEHAGIGERTIVSRPAIGGEAQVIGVLRLHDAGIVDAEKKRRIGERSALRDERLAERLRLGAGRTEDDAVAGTNYARKIDAHAGDATIGRTRNQERKMLDAHALDVLFREAHSTHAFTEPVTDEQLHALYDVMKWGPTAFNTQPGRFVFVRSK